MEDTDREGIIISRHKETASKVGVSSEAVEKLFSVLFSISKERQKNILDKDV